MIIINHFNNNKIKIMERNYNKYNRTGQGNQEKSKQAAAPETPYEYWLKKALQRAETAETALNAAKEKSQEVKPVQEHICAVCLNIMVEPCRFPSCGQHYFCI